MAKSAVPPLMMRWANLVARHVADYSPFVIVCVMSVCPSSLLRNGSTVLNLMIWNAAIYCTLVIQDIVIVSSAEPWLISRGENAIAYWATLLGPCCSVK